MAAVDNAIIRNSSPKELARYFQELLASSDWKAISDHIYAHIGLGSLVPTVVHVFLSVCKEPDAIAASIHQNVSSLARRVAINLFTKKLQSDSFSDMWIAMGGIQGLLKLVSEMSVDEVRLLCRNLGKTNTTKGPVEERQLCISGLYKALQNTTGEDDSVNFNPSTSIRPLGTVFDKIIPACTADIVLESVSTSRQPRKLICRVQIKYYQREFLAAVFPEKGNEKKITSYQFVLKSSDIWFSLTVLERLTVAPDSLKRNAENLIEELIRPLAKRLFHRREAVNVQIKFYRLLTQVIDMEPSVADKLDHNIIYYAAQAWERAHEKQETMEQLLTKLVCLMKPKHNWTFTQIIQQLQQVKCKLRFPLLRLLLQSARPFEINIDFPSTTDNEKLKSLNQSWPCRLFYLLPKDESLRLFRYLREIYVKGNFLSIKTDRGYQYWSTRVDNDHYASDDPDVFFALLNSWHMSDFQYLSETRRVLKHRKSKAEAAQDAEDRAGWAHSAVIISIASGQLDLYEDTLQWTRRFDRDPLTSMRLLDTETVSTNEGLDLLSAIPRHQKGHSISLTVIEHNVEHANRIIMKYMELISIYIREPSFNQYDIKELLGLPSKVIGRRMERLDTLQKNTQLCGHWIDAFVWEPTIRMMLELETLWLKEEYLEVKFSRPRGLLWESDVPKNPNGHALKFLDNLAKARDVFWEGYRMKIHPAVATLGKPWPKGLPIQCLLPRVPSTLTTSLEFLESRAQAVIFAPGEILLAPPPDDEEEREAIGQFVDDYKFALQIFISAVPKGIDRDNRIFNAWSHALKELTGSRMFRGESLWYWKKVFDSVSGLKLPDKIAEVFRIEDIALPECDDPEVPLEWNPDLRPMSQSSAFTVKYEPRRLPLSCLDCMLETSADRKNQTKDTAYLPFRPIWSSTVEGQSIPSVFDFYELKSSIPARIKDALAVAIIASLNATYGSNSSLLMKPFPSTSDVRFPALYLDDEFLEHKGEKTKRDTILRLLERVSDIVPTQLLEGLIKSLFARLGTDKDRDTYVLHAVVTMLKILSRGNKPLAACKFIKDFVVNHEADRSWNRHVLTVGFMNRLSPIEAKEFMVDLSSAILAKLDGQDDGVKLSKKVKETLLPPRVKVTTVKMIAQLLRNAKFIDPNTTCHVLASLLIAAAHVDIRMAALKSLLSILSETTNAALHSNIICVLENHIVPIAASLNGRHPLTEMEWTQAESEGCLPEVCGGRDMEDLPPILKLLVSSIPTGNDGVSLQRQEVWMNRIINPALKLMIADHRRWTALFLSRNGFSFSVEDLPSVPPHPRLLPDLLKASPRFLPGYALDSIKKLMMININPPEGVKVINDVINNNTRFLQSQAGEHWILMWGGTDHIQDLGISQAISLLLSEDLNASRDGLGSITVDALKEFVTDMAEVYISTSNTTEFDDLIGVVGFSGRGKSPEIHEAFMRNCLPILKDLISRIDHLRTPIWQHDPNRKPTELPDSFSIKLKILEGSHWKPHWKTMSANDYRMFARSVSELIEDISVDQTPYHHKWKALKRIAMRRFPRTDFVPLALEFGSLEAIGQSNLNLADHLRVELAGDLLAEAEEPMDAESSAKALKLLRSWGDSHIEAARSWASYLLMTRKNNKKFGQYDWTTKPYGYGRYAGSDNAGF
ncbi:uncharacterized protein GGS25DRAFT_487044 [Hypoxylon fragiforme]|uniref:uncharacterized protein n=1 Tax=Hypoxylon fragiforme TaxID=63214 RepID=UPI0020C711A1|nr:uncharacterized protein GGS25DRAFT_487044 [Hypoxylon fragiforme]KAI2609988.1 hypothetical protein GGS25DRAFT_487044 [Hypoxylon fragiforme]